MMVTAPTADRPTTESDRLRERLQRARQWLQTHRLLVRRVGIGMASLMLLGGGYWLYLSMQPEPPKYDLDAAIEALDAGDDRFAIRIVKEFLPWGDLLEQRRWIPPYVLGMTELRKTRLQWGDKLRQTQLLAARFLDAANEYEVPSTRRPSILYDLGRVQLQLGLRQQAIGHLRAALPLNPTRTIEIRRLLIEAHMQLSPPANETAYQDVLVYLNDPQLSASDRELGWLLQGQLLSRMNQFDDAIQVFDNIPDNSKSRSAALFEQGRIWLQQAQSLQPADDQPKRSTEHQIDALYRRAIKAFEDTPVRDNWSTEYAPRALLFAARCRYLNDQAESALKGYALLQRWYPETIEAHTGRFEAAEILLRQGEADQAMQEFRAAFNEFGPHQLYDNPWLGLREMRERVIEAHRYLMHRNDYIRAAALAECAAQMPVDVVIWQLGGEANRALGTARLRDAETQPYVEAERLRGEARAAFHAAAINYERLAWAHRASSSYPQDIWEAAEARLAAGEYEQAIERLNDYLATYARPQRTAATVAHVECLLNLSRVEEALAMLDQTEALSNADAFKSRLPLLTARAYLLRNDLKSAEKVLRELLNNDLLTPDAKDWKDALFLLARVLYDGEQFDEAMLKFEEAVARYPRSDEAREAQYLLAEAYRRAADQVEIDSQQEGLNDDDRQERRKQAKALYESALEAYRTSISMLEYREITGQITPTEQRLLRNAQFARGATLHSLFRDDEAVSAYLVVVNRYQNTPEVLDALVQIAFCYRRMQRPIEARGTLLQAKLILERLPTDTPFTLTTNFSRDEWAQWLASLIAL